MDENCCGEFNPIWGEDKDVGSVWIYVQCFGDRMNVRDNGKTGNQNSTDLDCKIIFFASTVDLIGILIGIHNPSSPDGDPSF
jgi:hypothetical protein